MFVAFGCRVVLLTWSMNALSGLKSMAGLVLLLVYQDHKHSCREHMHMHTYAHTCTHICTPMQTRKRMHTHAHTCMHTHAHICSLASSSLSSVQVLHFSFVLQCLWFNSGLLLLRSADQNLQNKVQETQKKMKMSQPLLRSFSFASHKWKV